MNWLQIFFTFYFCAAFAAVVYLLWRHAVGAGHQQQQLQHTMTESAAKSADAALRASDAALKATEAVHKLSDSTQKLAEVMHLMLVEKNKDAD